MSLKNISVYKFENAKSKVVYSENTFDKALVLKIHVLSYNQF